MAAMAAILEFSTERFQLFCTTSHPYASYKFRVNWPFSSGEEAKNISSWPWWQSWISNQNIFFFFLFLIYKSPQSFLLESIGLSVQKWKLDIQEGHHGRHLGFTVWTILLFFIYKSPRCFLLSFVPIGLKASGEEKKNRFSRRLPRRIWISDRHNFSFLFYKPPRCFLPSFESIGLSVQEKKPKIKNISGFR